MFLLKLLVVVCNVSKGGGEGVRVMEKDGIEDDGLLKSSSSLGGI